MLTLYIHGLVVPAAGGARPRRQGLAAVADIRRALSGRVRRLTRHSLLSGTRVPRVSRRDTPPAVTGPQGAAHVLARPPTDRAARAQIRVVNAFRQGLDSRGSLADAALAEALRKQTALSKRFSHSSSIEYADAARDTLAPHDIDVERLSSHSHTETAV